LAAAFAAMIVAHLFFGPHRLGPVEAAVARAAAPDRDLAAFYRDRGDRPVWIVGAHLRPEALGVIAAISNAKSDGLDPRVYGPELLTREVAAARSGDRDKLVMAEIGLSRALAAYVGDLRRPPPGEEEQMYFADPALPPPATGERDVLDEATSAPALGAWLADARRVNPVYAVLKQEYATWRARWDGLPRIPLTEGADPGPGDRGDVVRTLRVRLGLPTVGKDADLYDRTLQNRVAAFQSDHGLNANGVADAATIAALNAPPDRWDALIVANIERARILPANLGARYVVMNAPAASLWFYEHGRAKGGMEVVVGKPDDQTPLMTAMIRYAVVNPYWNVPPDLTSDRLAPRVLAHGTGVLASEHLQVLSDWSDKATVIDPKTVDWGAVARGDELRVRQLPGPDNMMGAIKFMLPNDLGVYLHDTPHRDAFTQKSRLLSAGCVRLESPGVLAKWLFGHDVKGDASGKPEQIAKLAPPVPVYLVYFTVQPTAHGLVFLPDVYNRDAAAIAALRREGRIQTSS
jgi:murein L,D-transpeptidase YcbB/YkuD